MSKEHPDRDSLSAYFEETLSIDATQWVERHLGGCDECRAKLEEEQAFLAELDRLGALEPPADFTEGVMARVAQYPAYQPGKKMNWRRMGAWMASAAMAGFAVLGFVGWVLLQNADGGVVTAPDAVPNYVKWFADTFQAFALWAWRSMEGIFAVLMIGVQILGGIFDFVRQQNLAVTLAFLLIVVGLNYWVTRMVLNYQRRQ